MAVAIDETSSRRGRNYQTPVADMAARRVTFFTTERASKTIVEFAQNLRERATDPEQIAAVSIDKSLAFINEGLPI